MTEIGESVDRVDTLLKETKVFHSLCASDIERAEDVLSIGTFSFVLQKDKIIFTGEFECLI